MDGHDKVYEIREWLDDEGNTTKVEKIDMEAAVTVIQDSKDIQDLLKTQEFKEKVATDNLKKATYDNESSESTSITTRNVRENESKEVFKKQDISRIFKKLDALEEQENEEERAKVENGEIRRGSGFLGRGWKKGFLVKNKNNNNDKRGIRHEGKMEKKISSEVEGNKNTDDIIDNHTQSVSSFHTFKDSLDLARVSVKGIDGDSSIVDESFIKNSISTCSTSTASFASQSSVNSNYTSIPSNGPVLFPQEGVTTFTPDTNSLDCINSSEKSVDHQNEKEKGVRFDLRESILFIEEDEYGEFMDKNSKANVYTFEENNNKHSKDGVIKGDNHTTCNKVNKVSLNDCNTSDTSLDNSDIKTNMQRVNGEIKSILKPSTKFPPAIEKPKTKFVRGIRKNFLRAVGKMPPRQISRNNPNIDMFKINKKLRKSLKDCPDIGEIPVAFSGHILEHEVGEGYFLHRNDGEEEEEEEGGGGDNDSDENQSNCTNSSKSEQNKEDFMAKTLNSRDENPSVQVLSRFKQMKMAERNEL